MDIAKSYIVDKDGKPEAVIVDYSTFKKFEELLLDAWLGKAMEEVADEEEIDLKEAKRLASRISLSI